MDNKQRGRASCGHFADADGECSCSWWPERAPYESYRDAERAQGDLDRFSTDELERMHQRLADTGTVLYQRALTLIEARARLPLNDFEAYRAAVDEVEVILAAGAENYELLVSVGRELRHRQETSRV